MLISTPVCWPTVFSASSIVPASFASRPNAAKTLLTLSTDVDTSVSLIYANCKNWRDRSSRACPVSPNRVFTSPIAEPAVSKSVGMEVARFSMISRIPSKASPEAPVFDVMMSRPLSTSLKAAKEATPMAAIGTVRPLVRVEPAFDMVDAIDEVRLSPAFLPAVSPAGVAAPVRSLVICACAPCIVGMMVTVA